MITIRRIETADDLDLTRANELLRQLDAGAFPLSRQDAARVLGGANAAGYGAFDPRGVLVGIAFLAWYESPTGKKGWVEDVVVDTTHRGKNIGRRLMERIAGDARDLGVTTLNLTSRPSRKAANALYRTLGFALRETNCYALRLT